MRSTSFALLLFVCISVRAETITVAVASNFVIPMDDLAASFEQATGHRIAPTYLPSLDLANIEPIREPSSSA